MSEHVRFTPESGHSSAHPAMRYGRAASANRKQTPRPL